MSHVPGSQLAKSLLFSAPYSPQRGECASKAQITSAIPVFKPVERFKSQTPNKGPRVSVVTSALWYPLPATTGPLGTLLKNY